MVNERQYFIDGFFNGFLPNVKSVFFEQRFKKLSTYLILLLFIIILPISAILFLFFAYEKDISSIREIQGFLQEQNIKNIKPSTKISELKLKLNKERVWQNRVFFFSLIDENLSNALDRAQHAHAEARAIPMLLMFLEENIDNFCHIKDVELILDAFNVYLMIIGKERFNKHQVSAWYLSRINQIESFSGIQPEIIKEILDKIDVEMFRDVKLHDELYFRTIEKFRSANFPKLLFDSAINKSKEGRPFMVADFISQEFLYIFDKKLSEVQVPYIFTTEGYSKYMKYQTHVFNKMITVEHFYSLLDIGSLEELIQQTNYLYINKYIDSWNQFLSKVNLREFEKLDECLAVLRNISLDIYSMFEFSQLINKKFFVPDHEELDNIQKGFAVQISKEEYQAISYRIENATKYKSLDAKSMATLREKFFDTIRELTQYTAQVVDSPDQGFAAFNAVKDFENSKDNVLKKALEVTYILPEPISHLFLELINNIIDLLYHNAAGYINKNVNDYVSYWDHLNTSINLKKSINLVEYLAIIKNISADPGIISLFKLLDVVCLTSDIDAADSSLLEKQAMKSGQKAYHDALYRTADIIERVAIDGNLSGVKAKFLESTQSLTQYLAQIINSPDQGFAAFNAMKDFENSKDSVVKKALVQAYSLPANLGTIYQGLINNMVVLLYEAAEVYINQKWNEQVYKFYSQNLYTKYPFNKNNYSDPVLLSDFINFFATKGILENFTREYLTLKNVLIREDALAFIRFSESIKKSWFNKAGQLEVKFNIAPIQMGTNLSKVNFNLLNQNIQFTKDKYEIYELSWPNKEPEFAKIEFADNKKYVSSKYYEGQWSWYKSLGLDNFKQSDLVKTLQNNTIESPLGSIQFSINFSNEILLLSDGIAVLPGKVLETTTTRSFYADE